MSSLNSPGELIEELREGRALGEGTARAKAWDMNVHVGFWELVSDPAQARPSLQKGSKAKGWSVGHLTFYPKRAERLHGNMAGWGGARPLLDFFVVVRWRLQKVAFKPGPTLSHSHLSFPCRLNHSLFLFSVSPVIFQVCRSPWTNSQMHRPQCASVVLPWDFSLTAPGPGLAT